MTQPNRTSRTSPQGLPARPHLGQLKRQAKELVDLAQSGDPTAWGRIITHHPGASRWGATQQQQSLFRLHDAQLVLAREAGFPHWAKLKEFVESARKGEPTAEERFLDAIFQGNAGEVEAYLARYPRLTPSLAKEAALVLPKIVNRSVWHRPQYHRIAKELVRAGVECSIWDAARVGLLVAVTACLQREPALLNARDGQGRTPLQRAALVYGTHVECEEVVAYLLEHGAEVDLHTASTFGMLGAVRQALAASPEAVHHRVQGSTPLNWAVRPRREKGEGSVETVLAICRCLLDAGADLATTDYFESEMQPLHHAAEWGGTAAVIEFLLDAGADPTAKGSNGWTPLDYAVDRDRREAATLLKARGGVQTLKDWPNEFGEKRDLIIAASQRGEIETVRKLLLETPALASAREGSGATPLHSAAHEGFYEIAALLLEYGADPAAQETHLWGGSPLHWAAERQTPIVDLLLQHGVDVNLRNARTGQTPLHYSARCDDVPEVAALLLQAGADPHLLDEAGHAPLHYALKNDHHEVAGVLERWLERGEAPA